MIDLKSKLTNLEPSVGSWITLSHPAIAEIMANAGFDWLVVDLEHSVISLREAEDLIRTIELSDVIPLVRLTSNNSDQIKRVMDAGAHGIIVPMVNSADEAKRAVDCVRYPNIGVRSFGLARAQGYGAEFHKYVDWQKSSTIVIVQIEHIDAIDKVREILSVDGVDGFIIGPYDLSGSMGIPGEFQHPDFLQAVKTITDTAKELGKPGGIHIVEPDPDSVTCAINDGHKFIAYSVDIRMLDSTCRSALENIKRKEY